ncbi:diguanylate cyclase [Halomonas sp. CH40]
MQLHTPRSLRLRFLAALGGLLVLALFALAGVSTWLIFPALQAEERALMERELDRIERSFELDQRQLHAHVRDWAHWDDTYEFMQGDYPRYKEANFSQEMFEDMRYQIMAFFTPSGDVYFLAGINPSNGRYATCDAPTEGCAWMEPWVRSMQTAINNQQAKTKAIYVHQQPGLVSANPILRTDETGPQSGWLFKLRLMDEAWLSFMEEYTGLPISLSLASNPDTATDSDASRDHFSFNGNRAYAERDFPTYDAPDTPVLRAGIELNRTSYLTSLKTFRYVLLWTACLMIAVIGLVLLLLEKIILKPLRLLTYFTQQTDMSEADIQGLTRRNDEIGVLSRTFQQQFTRQQELNAELLNISTHDALTGLPNRRLFDQRLEEVFADAVASSRALAVIMLDIDHFKLYNDHYGHQDGDECLQKVADAFASVSNRLGFLIARTGGEEFSAILPDIQPEAARQIGEHLKQAVDSRQLPHPESPVKPFVTISIGVAMLGDSRSQTPSGVMSCADEALYLAKAAGRHQVVMYSSPKASPTSAKRNTSP